MEKKRNHFTIQLSDGDKKNNRRKMPCVRKLDSYVYGKVDEEGKIKAPT